MLSAPLRRLFREPGDFRRFNIEQRFELVSVQIDECKSLRFHYREQRKPQRLECFREQWPIRIAVILRRRFELVPGQRQFAVHRLVGTGKRRQVQRFPVEQWIDEFPIVGAGIFAFVLFIPKFVGIEKRLGDGQQR
jgi:hypothetical protein